MKDEEVGELWATGRGYGFKHRWGDVQNLILKLIEERALGKMGPGTYSTYVADTALKFACARFSIPYSEYLKAKEAKP